MLTERGSENHAERLTMQNRPFDIAKRPILQGQTACFGKRSDCNRNTLTYSALQERPPMATKPYKNAT